MRKTLAESLFPETRLAILAATTLRPQRWWFMSDLARHLGVRPSALQRELANLTEAGILVRRREGRQVYYRPHPDCPILPELQGIMSKTAGLADVLRESLRPFGRLIECAFICGSIARGEELSESDVDLMLIGTLRLSEISPALQRASERIHRPINPMLYTAKELAKKVAAGHHFLTTLLQQPKLFVSGDDNKLAEITGRRAGEESPDKQARIGRSARRG